jgi:hypothetical protein
MVDACAEIDGAARARIARDYLEHILAAHLTTGPLSTRTEHVYDPVRRVSPRNVFAADAAPGPAPRFISPSMGTEAPRAATLTVNL